MQIMRKTTSVGCSWGSVLPGEFSLKFHHLLLQLKKPTRKGDFSVIVGQVSLVPLQSSLLRQPDEPFDVFISGKRLSDIVNLFTPILYFGVRKEQDSVKCFRLGGNINQFSTWVFPDCMELGLNKNFWPFPDGPTINLFSSVQCNMLWNNVNAIIEWFIMQGPKWDENGGITFANLPAK